MGAELCQAFAQLHTLLKNLQDAEQLLQYGPKRIAKSEKNIQIAEQECAEQKEKLKQLRKSADQSAMNLKSQEAEVAKLSLQLNEASSNKEYEIIQGQMTAKKEQDASLEDEILAMLEEVDVATAELKEKERDLEELKQKTIDIRADVQAKEPGLNSEVERLQGEIAEAESIIPNGVEKDTYRRLRVAQGAAAMARSLDGYCEECNTQATPQDAVRMNMGEFILCRECGRVLYRAEAE